MLNVHVIQLMLLVAKWTISAVAGDSSQTTCIVRISCVPLRDDYTFVPGIGAYKLHTTAAPWDTARNTCEQEGGFLAVPNSVAEATAIGRVFANGSAISGTSQQNFALIGFHDLFESGEYVTIFSFTLSRSGYDTFLAGEPNNAGGSEHCGSINRDGLLNDLSCTRPFGFICELALCNSYITY